MKKDKTTIGYRVIKDGERYDFRAKNDTDAKKILKSLTSTKQKENGERK